MAPQSYNIANPRFAALVISQPIANSDMATQFHTAISPALTDTSSTYHRPASPSSPRQGPVPVVVVPPHFEVLQPQDKEATRILKREDERQKLFDKVSNTVLDIPNGYREVHVLIIRWDERVDEFKGHNKEVSPY
jgi:hypothetical protein